MQLVRFLGFIIFHYTFYIENAQKSHHMIYPLTLKIKKALKQSLFYRYPRAFDFGLLLPPNGLFSPVSRGGRPVC